jgi:hypothetical protein
VQGDDTEGQGGPSSPTRGMQRCQSAMGKSPHGGQIWADNRRVGVGTCRYIPDVAQYTRRKRALLRNPGFLHKSYGALYVLDGFPKF